METTQLTPEAPVQPEAPERLSSTSRFQLPKKQQKMAQAAGPDPRRGRGPPPAPAPPALWRPRSLLRQYQPVPVQRQDLTVSVDGSGTMTPIESYQVGALVSGEILEAPFQDGDRVEKGQLLYRIDPGQRRHRAGAGPAGRPAGPADL